MDVNIIQILLGENYPENTHPKTPEIPDNETYVIKDAFLLRMSPPHTKSKWNINNIARNTTCSEELSFLKYVPRMIKLYKIDRNSVTVLTKKKKGRKKQTNNCGA